MSTNHVVAMVAVAPHVSAYIAQCQQPWILVTMVAGHLVGDHNCQDMEERRALRALFDHERMYCASPGINILMKLSGS